jgi:hypothetical protein
LLQEESIEYVAGTIQRLLQEDAAQQQEEQEQDSEEEQEEGQQAGLPAWRLRPFRRLYLICTCAYRCQAGLQMIAVIGTGCAEALAPMGAASSVQH